MGLFQLLKEFFKVKNDEVEEVSLTNIEEWLLKQSNTLEKSREMELELNNFVSKA